MKATVSKRAHMAGNCTLFTALKDLEGCAQGPNRVAETLKIGINALLS